MIALAATDGEWLAYLSSHPEIRRINFWTPTPWNVRSLHHGDAFYFVRKGAEPRKIGGWGVFEEYTNLPARAAWAEFGAGNGCATYDEMLHRLSSIAASRSETFEGGPNPTIGCIVLRDPAFLAEAQQRSAKEFGLDFPRQVVKFKTFDHAPLAFPAPAVTRPSTSPPPPLNLGQLADLGALDAARETAARLEQGLVRVLLLKGQETGRCALCGAEFPVAFLVAAHIKRRADCSDEERRDLNNLMLACKFGCDELFERGYLSVCDSKIVARHDLPATPLVRRELEELQGRSCSAWSERSERFFRSHAQYHGSHGDS